MLKYNKYHITLAENGRSNNFAVCKPQKNYLRFELRIPKSQEISDILEKSDIDTIGYDDRRGLYLLRLTEDDIKKNESVLKELLLKAYNN